MPTFSNIPCFALDPHENQLVFSLLGRKCISQYTSVVQLFKTMGPRHSTWTKFYTGALCLVKDSTKRSYYLRLYDMKYLKLCWEQELYDGIRFEKPTEFLITFEGDKEIICLNFLTSTEASEFFKIANKKSGGKHNNVSKIAATKAPEGKKKKKLQKKDISTPLTETFVHKVSQNNTKIDIDSCLDLANIPLELRKQVLDRVFNSSSIMKDRPLPEVPGRQRSRPPTWIPPTPPVQNSPDPLKLNPSAQWKREGVVPHNRMAPNLPTMPAVPPPIPKTLPPMPRITPTMPRVPHNPPPVPGIRSPFPGPPPPMAPGPLIASSPTEDKAPRQDLLQQIQLGVTLKKADDISRGSTNDDVDQGSDSPQIDALAAALRKAIDNRGRVTQKSDDESSSSGFNSGWDDD